jgi:hypothetical protein
MKSLAIKPRNRVVSNGARSTPVGPRYANWWSRILLAGQFERQFIVPCTPHPMVRTLMRGIERGLIRPRPDGIEIRKPIFLVGLHRSGTTMVQDLICSLPEVGYITNVMNVYPESLCAAEMVRRHCRLDITGERYLADGVQVHGGTPNEGVALWQRWLDEEPYDCRYVEHRRDTLGEARVDRLFRDLRCVLWCFRPRANRFFCKNPCLTPHVLLLAELFPDARFLHIVRDPRNVANSMVRLYRLTQQQLQRIRAHGRHGVYDNQPYMPFPRFSRLVEYVDSFGADDIRTSAALWRDGVNWLQAARPQLGAFLEVRYEDIVADPALQMQHILEFCELDIPPGETQFAQKLREVKHAAPRTDYDRFDVIEDICRDEMQRLGYETKGRAVPARSFAFTTGASTRN